MNEITLFIPNKCSEAANQVKDWVEHATATSGCPVKVVLSGQQDSGRVIIGDATHLTKQEYTDVESAVHAYNCRRLALREDGWKANAGAKEDLQDNIEKWGKLLDDFLAKQGIEESTENTNR